MTKEINGSMSLCSKFYVIFLLYFFFTSLYKIYSKVHIWQPRDQIYRQIYFVWPAFCFKKFNFKGLYWPCALYLSKSFYDVFKIGYMLVILVDISDVISSIHNKNNSIAIILKLFPQSEFKNFKCISFGSSHSAYFCVNCQESYILSMSIPCLNPGTGTKAVSQIWLNLISLPEMGGFFFFSEMQGPI